MVVYWFNENLGLSTPGSKRDKWEKLRKIRSNMNSSKKLTNRLFIQGKVCK